VSTTGLSPLKQKEAIISGGNYKVVSIFVKLEP